MMKKTNDLTDLQTRLDQTLEREKRCLADYQNLLRRSQQDRIGWIKMANQDLLLALLEPLDHLSLAAEALNDQGLKLALGQLEQVLKQFGLEKIEVMGKEFNVQEMEAVAGGQRTEDGELKEKILIVKKVVKNGYKLNGELLRVAKVIV